MVARRPLAQVLQTAVFDPALLPYYLLANVLALPSTSEWWLRLPSVLAMAAAVVASRPCWPPGGRPAARAPRGGAMLVLPAVSRYGQDARPYAFSVLLVVASDALLVRRTRPLVAPGGLRRTRGGARTAAAVRPAHPAGAGR